MSSLEYPGRGGRKRSQRNVWLLGARPRTLPAAVVPVAVGSAAAEGAFHPLLALGALVVALALQVGVNYANDYSDGVRGTDEVRVGPVRLVASGLVEPPRVKRAAMISFAVAAVVGLVLSLIVQPLLVLVIGIPSILAAWFYTGGKSPYGYAGLGEVAVFVFFGLAATMGSTYLQSQQLTVLSLLCGTVCGLFAVALLVVNNLRDIEGDRAAGKKTLAVRMGDGPTRIFYLVCAVAPFLGVLLIAQTRPFAVIGLVGAILIVEPVRRVINGATGPLLVSVLGATGKAQLLLGVFLAGGLALSP